MTFKARKAFWGVALGDNSKLANLAKLAIDEAEKNPPQRTWVGLTDEETDFIIRQPHGGADPQEWARNLASALEAKLKEKNT